MTNRFTENARRVLADAARTAGELGHAHIGSEHILLAITLDGESTAMRVLRGEGITSDGVRRRLIALLGMGESCVLTADDMTPLCKKLLLDSSVCSRSQRYGFIGSEHLLMAMLREDCNGRRMMQSMRRMCMPEIPEEDFVQAIRTLCRVEEAWVPDEIGSSLYFRPLAIATTPKLGVHASAPYSGAIFNLASGRYEYEPEGVQVQKKTLTPAAARKDSIYGKLTAALARLTALVGAFRGRTNKDVAKFADQINMLCDKWQ